MGSPSSGTDARGRAGAMLALGALGVVFGDIGTSPLYAFATALGDQPGRRLDEATVYGLTSMVVWVLVLVAGVLYVGVLLGHDNEGEGGLLALLGLLRQRVRSRAGTAALVGVAMVGAAAFLGDSVITPAISVLSSVEGLETAAPSLAAVVVPVATGILVALFLVQRFGTGPLAAVLGPVMLVWFASIAVMGAVTVVGDPGVLRALSPTYALAFAVEHPGLAFVSLGSVVLAVTGAEALYADLGHFGRRAISRAWWCVVLPALVLSYLGQASTVLADPRTAGSPFFAHVPTWAVWPVTVLATAATVIASQAVVSGAFTVVHQAGRLGLLPELRVVHTSESNPRQIFLPAVNALLAVAVLALVVGFGSSARLASAYGVAVTTTITATTLLLWVLVWTSAPRSFARVLLASGLLVLAVTLTLSTYPKLLTGGWLPVSLAAVLLVVMSTWRWGRRATLAARGPHAVPLADLVARVRGRAHTWTVVRTVGVYLSRDAATAPTALVGPLERERLLHRVVVVMALETSHLARVGDDDRLRVTTEPVGEAQLVTVTATRGYAERSAPVEVLREVVALRPEAFRGTDPDDATFYLSTSVPVASGRRPRWRAALYVAMQRLAPDVSDRLRLPAGRTVVHGVRTEL